MRYRVFLSVVAALLALGLATGAVAAGGRPLSAHLSGAAEVPGPGDPDGHGTAAITVNQGQGEICYTLTATDIAPASAAHIHVGGSTSSGGVVVALDPPTNGTSTGCVTVARALAKAIKKHPENYYVNIHNAEFPGGAIRGQLGK